MGRKKEEKVIEVSDPIIPEDIKGAAREAWDSVVKDLKSLGKLHKADSKLIALYARNHALYLRVCEELATSPLVSDGGNGRAFANPLATMYPSLAAKDRQLLNDLGLTPNTRKDLGEDDDFTAFMRT